MGLTTVTPGAAFSAGVAAPSPKPGVAEIPFTYVLRQNVDPGQTVIGAQITDSDSEFIWLATEFRFEGAGGTNGGGANPLVLFRLQVGNNYYINDLMYAVSWNGCRGLVPTPIPMGSPILIPPGGKMGVEVTVSAGGPSGQVTATFIGRKRLPAERVCQSQASFPEDFLPARDLLLLPTWSHDDPRHPDHSVYNPFACDALGGLPPSAFRTPEGYRDVAASYVWPVSGAGALQLLTANLEVVDQVVNVSIDAPFLLRAIQVFHTTGQPIALRVWDGDGRYISKGFIASPCLNSFQTGLDYFNPGPVVPEALYPAGGKIVLDVANLHPLNDTNVQIVFWGVKRYKKV